MEKWLEDSGYSLLVQEIQNIKGENKFPIFMFDGLKTYFLFMFPAGANGAEGDSFYTKIMKYLILCGKISKSSFDDFSKSLHCNDQAIYLSWKRVGRGFVDFIGEENFKELLPLGD
jgi:hypothetical protein